MRFLADESCDFAVVRALRKAGHDVAAVCETSPGVADEVVVGMAIRERRILLTEDKDFGRLVFASPKDSPGVIFIRFPANARHALAETILRLVARGEAGLEGRFVVVQPGRIRVT